MNALEKKDGYSSHIKKQTDYEGGSNIPVGDKNSENFRSRLMESLLRKRAETAEALKQLMSTQKEYEGILTAGDYIDEVDDAQREISAQNLYYIIERKAKELKKIEWLIEKVPKDRNIGVCEECGNPIPEERLLIIPETTLCVKCQRELEKAEK